MPSVPVYSREVLYRFLWDNTDENNNLVIPQGKVAGILGMDLWHMSNIFSEFTALGLLEKQGHTFTLLYDPDKVPWEKYEGLRKKYSEHKSKKKKKMELK